MCVCVCVCVCACACVCVGERASLNVYVLKLVLCLGWKTHTHARTCVCVRVIWSIPSPDPLGGMEYATVFLKVTVKSQGHTNTTTVSETTTTRLCVVLQKMSRKKFAVASWTSCVVALCSLCRVLLLLPPVSQQANPECVGLL